MKIIDNLRKKLDNLSGGKDQLLILAIVFLVVAIARGLYQYFGCEMGESWSCKTISVGKVGIAIAICISAWVVIVSLWNNPQWLNRDDGVETDKRK